MERDKWKRKTSMFLWGNSGFLSGVLFSSLGLTKSATVPSGLDIRAARPFSVPGYSGGWLIGYNWGFVSCGFGLAGRHKSAVHGWKESEVRVWIQWLLSFGLLGVAVRWPSTLLGMEWLGRSVDGPKCKGPLLPALGIIFPDGFPEPCSCLCTLLRFLSLNVQFHSCGVSYFNNQ